MVELSLTLSTRHNAGAVKHIVEGGIRRMFPNNAKFIHEAKFAEEAAIYSPTSPRIKWEYLQTPGSRPGRCINMIKLN